MPGSRPEVGSSRKSSDGLVSSSSATLTRLRWPPESWRIRVVACGGPGSARPAPRRPGRCARPRVVSPGKRSSAAYWSARRTVSCGVQDVVLRDQADALAQLGVVARRGRGRRRDACPGRPGARPVSALSSVDLPEPLGPMTATRHFSGTREGDVVQQDLALVDRDGQVLAR